MNWNHATSCQRDTTKIIITHVAENNFVCQATERLYNYNFNIIYYAMELSP